MIQKVLNILFIVIIAVLATLMFNISNNYKAEKAISEQNYKALQDTVRIEKNKADELQYQKLALVADKDNLGQLNKSLADEVNKQKGNVIYLTAINARLYDENSALKVENSTIKDSISAIGKDSSYTIYWNFSKVYSPKNYRVIEGSTGIKLLKNQPVSIGSRLGNFDISFELTTGLSETKEHQLEIWVKTDYPNLAFTGINGAIIDPTKSEVIKSFFPPKRWQIGWQFGYGLGLSSMRFQPYLGVGISYRIYSF